MAGPLLSIRKRLRDKTRLGVVLQLNKYETGHIFFLLNQNLACDCLLIFVFYPLFTWAEPKIVLFWCSEQF